MDRIMYFKIKDNIIFRNYKTYGYLTDNSLFGYKVLNKKVELPGEKYVSESGMVMLDALTKEPRDIEVIIKELLNIFIDIDYNTLKQDTIDFYMQFVKDGFLSIDDYFEQCEDERVNLKHAYDDSLENKNEVLIDDCSTQTFHQNNFLRSLHIEVANECNERCVHCYIPHELKTKFIDSSLFYRIIEDGRNMNIINVTLSGGEPLLHKDLILFLKRCRELDLSVNLLSNLTLLTEEIISEMVNNPLLCVQTSIYSTIPDVHDSITKVKGSFEKTKAGVLKLIELGIPVQVSCPIMKQNKESFIDVIHWGNENNITVATDFVIFASYDHTNCNLINRLSLEEVRNAFNLQLTKNYADYLYENSKEKYALNGEDSICSICRYYLCISAEGNVFPCVGWQTKKLGNLFENSINKIWENSNEIKSLRKIKRNSFPQCVSCDNRGYCTVCMMSNSNESTDAFKINDFHCEVAEMMRLRVESVLESNKL